LTDRCGARAHRRPVGASLLWRPGVLRGAIREDELTAAVERAECPAALFDDDRRFVAANDLYPELHGLERDRLTGRRFDDFVHPERLEGAIADFDRILEDGHLISTRRVIDGDGVVTEVLRHCTANVLPGRHLLLSIDTRRLAADDVDPADVPTPVPLVVVGCERLAAGLVADAVHRPARHPVVARDVGFHTLDTLIPSYRPGLAVLVSSRAAQSGPSGVAEAVSTVLGLANDGGFETKVLAVLHSDSPRLARAVLDAGAMAVVGPGDDGEGPLRALDRMHVGETYIHPSLAMGMINSEAHGAAGLTDREATIARLLALGWTNAECAAELTLSPRTIDSHRARIADKLGISGRRELVAWALDHGLLDA